MNAALLKQVNVPPEIKLALKNMNMKRPIQFASFQSALDDSCAASGLPLAIMPKFEITAYQIFADLFKDDNSPQLQLQAQYARLAMARLHEENNNPLQAYAALAEVFTFLDAPQKSQTLLPERNAISAEAATLGTAIICRMATYVAADLTPNAILPAQNMTSLFTICGLQQKTVIKAITLKYLQTGAQKSEMALHQDDVFNLHSDLRTIRHYCEMRAFPIDAASLIQFKKSLSDLILAHRDSLPLVPIAATHQVRPFDFMQPPVGKDPNLRQYVV